MTNSEVAAAWREGRKAQSAHMRTDGRLLYSYKHVIGRTEDGYKIAVCCHASQTTRTRHVPAALKEATAATECPEHSQSRCRIYRATLVRPMNEVSLPSGTPNVGTEVA